MPVDLKGNTNFVCLKNLQDEYIVPRTNLAAVDINVANGLAVTGNTIYVKVATSADIASGTTGSIVTPDGLYPFISQMQTTLTPGVGINITSSTVSTADVPQSAITGLSTSLAAKQDNLTAGYRMAIVSGSTVDQQRYFPIESATGSTVTLQAGHAYKIQATNSSKTLTAETIPANQFGLEGHAEIFVAGTGMVKTTSSVVLATPLEPDAVNNCTVRFHDGMAIISVEDHLAGAIVTVNSGTIAGSLPYALQNLSSEYIAFDASTDGTPIDMANAVTYAGEKHVVGNGYTQTVISGGISCTSKTTFSNLGMNGVSILDGTATLGDVFIPNGATVAVSGGGLAVEKVTGAGSESVIDLGGTHVAFRPGITASASGVIFSGGSASGNGGAIYLYNNATTDMQNISAVGCISEGNGGFIIATDGAVCTLTSATISGCSAVYGGGIRNNSGGTTILSDCVISGNSYADISLGGGTVSVIGGTFGLIHIAGGIVEFSDEVKLDNVTSQSTSNYGSVTLTSGAILDLSGNMNATPIAPGGGITFASGGATVLVGSGIASSSYSMDNVTLPAGAKLTNTNVVNLGGANVVVSSNQTARINGISLTGGINSSGGAVYVSSYGTLYMSNCVIAGNSASVGGGLYNLGAVYLTNVLFDGNTATATNGIQNEIGAVYLTGCTFGANQSVIPGNTSNSFISLSGTNKTLRTIAYGAGRVILESGAILDLTDNNITSVIAPGGGIVISSGGINIIDSAGSTHEFHRLAITGSTINNLGQILGATVSVPVSSGSLGPWIISTTLGSSTVSATDEAQEIVIDGGLVSIIEL